MAGPAPIQLQIIGGDGKIFVATAVPFIPRMTARDLLEQAFIIGQTSVQPDTFLYQVQFYGYSYLAAYPGYLGYEIETMGPEKNKLWTNTGNAYWELFIDGQPATVGMDSLEPNPGGSIRWQYVDSATVPGPTLRSQIMTKKAAT